MALPVNRRRYILMLSVRGGWPDEAVVPRPDDIERELEPDPAAAISVHTAGRIQNPAANIRRYYELEADSAVTPIQIRDLLVAAVERLAAVARSRLEVHIALATAEGETVAEGAARPQAQ